MKTLLSIRSGLRFFFGLEVFLVMLAAPNLAFALDAPHDITNIPQVCNQCHISHGSASSYLTSNPSGINALCLACHDGSVAIEVDTHQSSVAAGEDYNFVMKCTDCHDPHTQPTSGITWTNARGTKSLLRSSIRTPNNGWRSIVLNASTGANSFADGNSPYNGVCEVCHTQTTKHQNTSAQDHTHEAGNDCRTCHAHNDPGANSFGYKPSGGDCTGCHNAVKGSRRITTTDFTGTAYHHIQLVLLLAPRTRILILNLPRNSLPSSSLPLTGTS